jgi:hypothetical protein
MHIPVLFVVSALAAPAAMGQSPLTLTSNVESGWTSNALESSGTSPDFYLRHNHDLSVTGTMGPLALRGGLVLEQQVFRTYAGENDVSVTGGIEAGLKLDESMSLRLGYALTHEWKGEMLDLGPVMLTISNPALEHEVLGEVAMAGVGRAVIMGFDLRLRQPGLAELDSLLLLPEKIDPEVGQVTGRVDGEWVISSEMAGLARLHWIRAAVPDADRATFGREPASVARVAGGLRLQQAQWSAEARAGFDLVWPQAAPHLRHFLPYLDAKADLALTDQLSVTARVLAAADVFNPLDGVASRNLEAELGARLALSDGLAVSAGLATRREEGLFEDGLVNTRRSVKGGLSFVVAPGLELGLVASHAEVEEPGAAYPVTTIGMTLAGRV